MKRTPIYFQLEIGGLNGGGGEPDVEQCYPNDVLSDETIAEIGRKIAALSGVRDEVQRVVESGKATDPQTGKEIDHRFGENRARDGMILEAMLAKAAGDNVVLCNDHWI